MYAEAWVHLEGTACHAHDSELLNQLWRSNLQNCQNQQHLLRYAKPVFYTPISLCFATFFGWLRTVFPTYLVTLLCLNLRMCCWVFLSACEQGFSSLMKHQSHNSPKHDHLIKRGVSERCSLFKCIAVGPGIWASSSACKERTTSVYVLLTLLFKWDRVTQLRSHECINFGSFQLENRRKRKYR